MDTIQVDRSDGDLKLILDRFLRLTNSMKFESSPIARSRWADCENYSLKSFLSSTAFIEHTFYLKLFSLKSPLRPLIWRVFGAR